MSSKVIILPLTGLGKGGEDEWISDYRAYIFYETNKGTYLTLICKYLGVSIFY
jgi:hypothetical protein